jgi:hypothetical protein
MFGLLNSKSTYLVTFTSEKGHQSIAKKRKATNSAGAPPRKKAIPHLSVQSGGGKKKPGKSKAKQTPQVKVKKPSRVSKNKADPQVGGGKGKKGKKPEPKTKFQFGGGKKAKCVTKKPCKATK